MHALTGYCDRWSLRAGERIRFMVGSLGDAPYSLRFVRLLCADPNPRGPGYREVAMPTPLDGERPGREQLAWTGSCAVAPALALPRGGWLLAATVFPTAPGRGRQVVLSLAAEALALELALAEDGSAEARCNGVTVSTGKPLAERQWCDMLLRLRDGRLEIRQHPRGGAAPAIAATDCPVPEATVARAVIAAVPGPGPAPFAAHFNGKIERPTVWGALEPEAALVAQRAPLPPPGDAVGLVACWDLAQGIPTQRAAEIGPQSAYATLRNLPTRAVTGATWTGAVHDWKQAPEQYAAIHFHDDDQGDLGWAESFALDVPADWPSGVYAAHLRNAEGEDMIPFYVRPAAGAPTAKVALLVPTFTYQVYSCYVRPGRGAEIRERAAGWGALLETPDMNPQFGLSTYNYHSDGSGVAITSMLRPQLDTRPRQMSLMDPSPDGSGTGRVNCDSYITEWLDRLGIDCDIVTDHDLHAEGVAALSPYRVVIAAQHPEYHSWRMLDGLDGFLAGGGRLMYLGGNGFYWRAEPSEDAPHALELRRAEGGIRVWPTMPGESYHAFGGGYGGLWRRIGRPAHRLVGNGFSVQGRHLGFPYRFAPDFLDPRVAFLREGIEAGPGDAFGDRGYMGGGAAGFELDSFDVGYGSPVHGLIVAKGVVIHDDYGPVNEDMLIHRHPRAREDWSCADLVFFETPAGGAVFSVGSMTYVGSLLVDGGDNTLAKLTANALRRFLDPAPFALPPEVA
ncbi:N,N-dimethylformamidase [Roseomonas sp. OT10]|uniref:N,N-dimethylformamidase beta subunit family domain-containing protein n=1 Tax=Roseomonas cutis TaxID=2897332 RepID=UPI001E4B7AFD|nr:N,N-dimethylformamidase beta subunit family domain-containing protein [Roseomonas sp. OT10]UFN48465.1 N,N-dimethylformamidase [Roseomonas sp. OT10]